MPVSIMPRTIRNRLLLVTACCLVTTFLGMTAVIAFGLPYGLLSGELHQQKHKALARLSAVADNKKGLLTLWFGERLGDLELARKNPLLADFLSALPPVAKGPGDGKIGMDQRRQEVVVWLRDIRRAYADYDHLELVAEQEGTILISTDSGRMGGKIPLPKQNTEENPIHGEPFAFFVRENEGQVAHLCLAVHLVSSGAEATPMALVFHVDTSKLISKLQDIPLLGASGGILLVDMNQILLTPLPYPLQNGAPAIPLQTKIETKMAQLAAWGNDSVMQEPDYRGVPVLGAVRHIRVLPDFGVGMVVKQDQAEVFAPIYRQMMILAAIAGAGLALLLLTIYFMTRTLLKPVEEVIAAACHLRDGDLSARAPETGSGEAQVLAIAFNVMAGEVQRWNETSEQERITLMDFNRIVIDQAPVGILVYDGLGQCIRVNQEAAELAGATTDLLLSQNFHALESWKQCGLYDLALQALASDTVVKGLVHIVTSFGREAWFNARFHRLRWDNDCLLLIVSDLTELKLTEDNLVRTNEELQDRTCRLEALNAELESFNHTVSHDLRTPIRALVGFPDLLEGHLGNRLDDKGRQYLAAIRLAARRMSEITTDLLNFSRLGRVAIAMTDVDLLVLVRKVREDLAAMADGREVEWQVADLPVVKGDANLLRIVLTNLLANALKFTRFKAPAVIRVDSLPGEDGIPVIKVSDNGAGFDMKYADRLFKVFSRLHPTEEFEGLGIGLATVSRIVKRHGGKIWAVSSPEGGASFSFTLAPSPLDASPPPLCSSKKDVGWVGAEGRNPAREGPAA